MYPITNLPDLGPTPTIYPHALLPGKPSSRTTFKGSRLATTIGIIPQYRRHAALVAQHNGRKGSQRRDQVHGPITIGQ